MDESSPAMLARYSMDDVEYRYREGRVSQNAFEAYMYLWAVGHPHSSLGAGWSAEPTHPGVVAIVAEVRALA